MTKTVHPLFKFPGSFFWIIPLIGSLLLFWSVGAVGSLWWYIIIPILIAFTFIDLFTTVWLGITIMVSLFLYCSVGSSGVPVSFAIWEPTAWVNLREIRGLEMTEFEWFHWWPFKWLVALLCLNMTIVTIRRIPLNLLTVGVWSIHTGVIVMILGCTVYFSYKIEGDVLISRREVVIKVPGTEPATMVVTPGNTITIGDTTYTIKEINPNWELMSGDDLGKQVYTVTVSVDTPTESFMRQLIAGYPQYTEDIVRTDNTQQPMARAKNVIGRALVDEDLVMLLDYDEQDTFYVTQSGAIYIRELTPSGTPRTKWIERPITNLPRFNDYISNMDEVRIPRSFDRQPKPLVLKVSPLVTEDPISDDILITSYLRYAFMDTQTAGGGDTLFPTVWVTLRKGDEAVQTLEMYAFDPNSSTADSSLMTFKWLENDLELQDLKNSLTPYLTATINGKTHRLTLTNKKEFITIGNSGFSFRLNALQNNLSIGETLVSLAQVDLKKGDKSWVRWVFDNSALNRDVIEGENHEGATFLDDTITMKYFPGTAPITIVGGIRDGEYVLLTSLIKDTAEETIIDIGKEIQITDEVTLTLDKADAFTRSITMPTVIPYAQRDPGLSNMYSMVEAQVSSNNSTTSVWLPYHHYPFESQQDVVRRFQYNPTTLQLQDGRLVEMLFSRRSAQLDSPIVLDSFEVDTHLGGFTGRTSSILNWRSLVKFRDGSDNTVAVSVNDPQPHGDLWFFQSQWDPPDTTSQGLNYTVLGVGNRRGVFQMLFGCCLAVAGMIWAFYVKPSIKRKRQQSVYANMVT